MVAGSTGLSNQVAQSIQGVADVQTSAIHIIMGMSQYYVFYSDVVRTLLTVLIDFFDKSHNIIVLTLIWSHLKLNQCYRNYLVQIYCHSSGVVHLTSSGLSSHAERLCVSRLFQERLAALTSARSTRTRSSSTGLSCVTMVTSPTCWRMSAGQWRQRIVDSVIHVAYSMYM